MDVYLCHNITEFFGYNFHDWSATVTFSVTLVNHDHKENSKTKEVSHVFEKNSEHNCFGWARFISIGDLYSGFAKEDALDFEVQFKSLEIYLV